LSWNLTLLKLWYCLDCVKQIKVFEQQQSKFVTLSKLVIKLCPNMFGLK
jgi:hypothetical protein